MYKLIILSILFIIMTNNIQAQSNTNYTLFKQQQKKDYAYLDSQAANYKTEPCYYIKLTNDGCLYDVRINDMYERKIWQPVASGGMLLPINSEILKSGKQKISLRLYPYEGETLITEKEPFTLKIGYKDFKQDETDPNAPEQWHWVWEMSTLEVPDTGLPYYELEAGFEAEVPREATGWSDCVDLREIPDIEQRVVAEFKRIRQMIVDKNYNELEVLLHYKNCDLAKAFYQTTFDLDKSWFSYKKGIEDSESDEWQEIEDYELVFYADGRLVTLESKKEDKYPSALLRFREIDIDEDNYDFLTKSLDMRLGIRKGTDQLIPIR